MRSVPTDTLVRSPVAPAPAYIPFKADGTAGEAVLLDAQKGLMLLEQIVTYAKCTPENPPNECQW